MLRFRSKKSASNAAQDKQKDADDSNKVIGTEQGPSFPMAPKGSFKNSDAAQSAMQTYNEQPNPYIVYDGAAYGDAGLDHNSKQGKSAEDSKDSSGSDEEEELLNGAQTLLTIPGAVVHLIDDEESVHLASGEFALVRFVQETTKVVVVASVGETLKWPIYQEQPTVKLDSSHYFFSIKVPKEIDNRSSTTSKHSLDSEDGTEMDTLNYGLTFPAEAVDEDSEDRIRELDTFLERYSMFSAPVIAKGEAAEAGKAAESLEKLRIKNPNLERKVVQAEDGTVSTEEAGAAFWTTIAPNVDDYNSRLAKGIATGAGHIIRGIFWFSDSYVDGLDSGHIYVKSKLKPKEKNSKISPLATGSVRRARQLSGMTDKVARGILGGVLHTTGIFSSAVVNSKPGKKFFKFLPGEVALVSLDAFGRVFDAVEKAGTNAMEHSSSVTQDFVNYRYGDQAKELTEEGLKTFGNMASTVWTITKLRKALNPKQKLKVSKTGVAKSLAKSAMGKK